MKYKDLSLTWAGDLTSISGPAQFARSLLRPLIEGGALIKLEPINSGLPQIEADPFWSPTIERLVKVQPGFIKVNHCPYGAITMNVLGGPNIWLAHWDTDVIPVGIASGTYKPSEIWHTFVVKEPSINIPTNHIVVPIDKVITNEVANLVEINSSTTVFGYTGFWDQRSNMQDLIVAFVNEFSSNDNVALVIKCTIPDGDPNKKAQVLNLVRSIKATVNKPNQPSIIVLQDNFSQATMDAIINRFNIYVSAARGWSTNITLGKCLAAGKIAVVPATKAAIALHKQIAYRDSRALRLVPVFKERVTGTPGGNPQDIWTRVDQFTLGEEMRLAHVNTIMPCKEVKDDIKDLQANIQRKMTPEIVADEFAKRITTMMPYYPVTLA